MAGKMVGLGKRMGFWGRGRGYFMVAEYFTSIFAIY
jgi:hypothetical protein